MLVLCVVALISCGGPMRVIPQRNALTEAAAQVQALARPYVPAPPRAQVIRAQQPGIQWPGDAWASADAGAGIVYAPNGLGRFERAHEFGHLFDGQVLGDGDRGYFTHLFGLKGPWYQGTASQGLRSPVEWFADYYGAAAIGFDPTRRGIASYADIDSRTLRRFEAALARLGHRRDLSAYAP
jgi:hypothetical protein